MDKENASDYGKSSLRGPPVQELHGYPLTYPTETSTPIFPGMLNHKIIDTLFASHVVLLYIHEHNNFF